MYTIEESIQICQENIAPKFLQWTKVVHIMPSESPSYSNIEIIKR